MAQLSYRSLFRHCPEKRYALLLRNFRYQHRGEAVATRHDQRRPPGKLRSDHLQSKHCSSHASLPQNDRSKLTTHFQMNLQPLEHRQLTQRGHNVSEIHQAYQGRDDSILLLDGLDTDVVASPSMVRALTEPFGDVVDLRHTETGDNNMRRLSVLVQYCCSSSAALARLSLHGLIVGANRILATDAPPWSSVACAPYDRASRGAAGTGSGPIEPGYGYGVVSNIRDQWTSVSQPQLSLRMTPSPDEVTTSTRNLVHVDQQSDAHGWGPYFESWQSSNSLDTPSSNDCKDPVFVEKVSLAAYFQTCNVDSAPHRDTRFRDCCSRSERRSYGTSLANSSAILSDPSVMNGNDILAQIGRPGDDDQSKAR